MEIRIARSATKHRVSRRDSLAIVEGADRRAQLLPPEGSDWSGERWAYIGVDSRGEWIEVIAVELEAEALLIIHAMPLRAKMLKLFEGSED
jgi:hypothetical protein